MDEGLLPGTRATPERWHARPVEPAPLGAAIPALPVIDWGAMLARPSAVEAVSDHRGVARVAQPQAAGGDWRQRFVNELGRPDAAATKNAGWRVSMPISASASVAVQPKLHSL
jgi:hypothetical protein